MAGQWFEVILLVNVGLKLDGITEYSWESMIWPLWVFQVLLLLISLSSFILILLNCWAKDAIGIISNFWVLYTFLIGFLSSTFSLFLFTISFQLYLAPLIFYLFGFIVLTILLKKQLAIWWRDMLISENAAEIQYPVDSPLPLPNSQALHMNFTFAEKLHKVVSFAPRALVKLSKNNLQTHSRKNSKKSHTRTNSFTVSNVKKANHVRAHSNFVSFQRMDEESKGNEQGLCSICRENESNCMFARCGHGEICSVCAQLIYESTKKCHICAGNVIKIVHLTKFVKK